MSLERGNPIPAGIYWIDVFQMTLANGENQSRLWNEWFTAHRDTVKILRTVHYDEQLARPGVSGPYPARDWVLFEILTPTTRWGVETGLGFPTRAPKAAETQAEDTADRPPPEDPASLQWPLLALGAVILIGGTAYLVHKSMVPRVGR